MNLLRWLLIVPYFCLAGLPLGWLALTSVKERPDTISVRPKFVPTAEGGPARDSVRFRPSAEGYRNLGVPVAGAGLPFGAYLANSVLIGILSTLASVLLGTACAYGFSRFRIAGARDWLFFVLSTRFMPPLAVIAPVLILFRRFGLPNTHLGLVVLYTGFNLSLAVWLMKGFIDEIPRSYEEAALVDGYTRGQAFRRVVLPHVAPGMAVTAVFCLISAWNEYGFAMTLNNARAVTAPVYFAGLQGNVHGLPWPQVAAGAIVFVAPVVLFTVLVRRHLLRGMTFGALKA